MVSLVRIVTLGHERKKQIPKGYLPLYIVGTNGDLRNQKIETRMENKEVNRDYIDFKTGVLIWGPQIPSKDLWIKCRGSVNLNGKHFDCSLTAN